MNKPDETPDFWRNWFNDQARTVSSDYALNRGTTLNLSELDRRAMAQFLQAVDPRPGDAVLDAGCGTGRNMSLLSPKVREIVGMDYSGEMIRRAIQRIDKENLRNVSAMTGDITNLPFADNQFDKVICASVLQYLDQAACRAAIFEMIRVCRPGGRLILHIKNGTSLYGLSLALLRPVARLLGRSMKPEFYRSRRWHQQTLAAAGGVVADYDGFGIFTFVPLPQRCVSALLRLEMSLPLPRTLRKVAVNYKVTAMVAKPSTR